MILAFSLSEIRRHWRVFFLFVFFCFKIFTYLASSSLNYGRWDLPFSTWDLVP